MSKYLLAAKQIAQVFRQHNLTYNTSKKVVQLARKQLGIMPERTVYKLPQLPTTEDAQKFWDALETGGNLRDIILLKLAYLTGCRNSEVRRIRQDQVDLLTNRIYISEGKGKKDRYVVFPDSFSLVLRAYMSTLESNWLFPGPSGKPITARTMQLRAAKYTSSSGISVLIHPHKLRHMILSHLTEMGMPDAKIQLISGHASRESLKIYQHVGLPGVQKEYEEAMKGKQ